MALQLSGVCPLVQVFDMPTSVRFYGDVLGFELVQNSPLVHGRDGDYFHWAMLRRDGITLMLNTAYDEGQRPAEPEAARTAGHGDTSLFFGCSDVGAVCEQLRSRGVRLEEELGVTRYGMRRFAILDPDGYLLCFQGPASQG